MKHTTLNLYGVALLAGATLSLSAANAKGQTFVRRSGVPVYYPYYSSPSAYALTRRTSATFNGLTATTNPLYAAYPSYVYRQYANSSQSSNQSFAPANTFLPGQSSGTRQQAQTSSQASGTVTAQRTAFNELLVQWRGDTSSVQQVTIGLFDVGGQMLDSMVFTQLPVQARFTLTNAASYFGVQVAYVSGTTNAVYYPLQ
jgi:hypothetical protein